MPAVTLGSRSNSLLFISKRPAEGPQNESSLGCERSRRLASRVAGSESIFTPTGIIKRCEQTI